MNARNSSTLAELQRSLGKSTEAHEAACELLEKADKHREKAHRHAARIAASQGADNADPDDGDEDGDFELAYAADRRKRMVEIAGRAQSGSRGPDAARRARTIEIARLVHSA